MKKFALTVTAATMIMGGLAGCGGDNQAQNVRNNDYRNLTIEQRGAGLTGHDTGEGPITDMMTTEDRNGGAGFGAAGTRENRGLFGTRADDDLNNRRITSSVHGGPEVGGLGTRGIGGNQGAMGLQGGPQMNDGETNENQNRNGGLTGLDLDRDLRIEARGLDDGQPSLGEGWAGETDDLIRLHGMDGRNNLRTFSLDEANGEVDNNNGNGEQRPLMGISGLVGDRPGMVGNNGFLNERAEQENRGILNGKVEQEDRGETVQKGIQARPGARVQQRTQN